MKVLLLGGTGAIGLPCIDALGYRGFEVYVTSRRQHEDSRLCHCIVGNAMDNAFLSMVLHEKWDCIIDFMNYSTGKFQSRINELLDSADQYIFISSARVYSNHDEVIKEQTPRLLDVTTDQAYLATDEYALHKARQENLLVASGKSNWTIVRPYISYNVNRLQLGVTEMPNWLVRAIQGRSIVFSRDIASKYTTLTYGGDVSEGIVALVGRKEALGEVFHITNNHSVLWGDVFEIYLDELGKYMGKRPKVRWTDTDLNLQVDNTKYQVMYDRLYNRRFDVTKISRFIDVSSFVPPEEGLRRCLRETLKNPSPGYINTSYEAMQDKLCHELTTLSNYPTLKLKLAYIYKRFFK